MCLQMLFWEQIFFIFIFWFNTCNIASYVLNFWNTTEIKLEAFQIIAFRSSVIDIYYLISLFVVLYYRLICNDWNMF